MVNLGVRYQRPNNALATLVAEVRARYGGSPIRVDYVTGYKSASNFTGHNADQHGVCHAVDIFVGTPGNLTEAQATDLVNWLQTEGPRGSIPGHPDRLYYMIFRDKIMGDWSGWTSWDGHGYGHWDHIHISTCDLYWGDPAPISHLDYDSTAAWGLSTISPAGSGTITPIEEDDILAGITEERFKQLVAEAVQPAHDVTRDVITERTQAQHDVTRGFLLDKTQAQADVTRGYLADRIRESSPADIVAAIPEGIAQEVLDGLTARLHAGASHG